MYTQICKNTEDVQFRHVHIYAFARIWESAFFFKYAVVESSNLFISLSWSWKSSDLWEKKWQRTNRNSVHFFQHFQNIITSFFLFQKWHHFSSKSCRGIDGVFKGLERMCSVSYIHVVVCETFKLMSNYSFIQILVFWPVRKKKEKNPKTSLPKLPSDVHSRFDCLSWKAVHKFVPSGIVAPQFLEVRDNKTLLDHPVHLTANVRQNNNKITALAARKFLLPDTSGVFFHWSTPLCTPHAQTW